MSDRERLTGFDTVYLGGGQLHSFRIPNTFPDRRGEFCGGKEFKCVVFDYADGEEYRLVADRTDGGAGQGCKASLPGFYAVTRVWRNFYA